MHKSQEASQGSAHLPQHQPLRVATHGCWCLSRAAASQGQVAMKSRKNGWHFATSFQALAQPPKWLMTALVGPLVPWLCKGAAADGDGVCCLGLFIDLANRNPATPKESGTRKLGFCLGREIGLTSRSFQELIRWIQAFRPAIQSSPHRLVLFHHVGVLVGVASHWQGRQNRAGKKLQDDRTDSQTKRAELRIPLHRG